MHVPTGRYEKRTPRAVQLELFHLDDSQRSKTAITENVSPRGVRIVSECDCPRGKHVVVTAHVEGVELLARVVYCQRVEGSKFAIGLELVVRVEEWGKRANHE